MTVNVRFSQHTTADGKKYLGGPLISGTVGVYSPTMTSTNAVFDEVLKQENIDGTKDYRCFYFQNNFTGQAVYEPKIEFVSISITSLFISALYFLLNHKYFLKFLFQQVHLRLLYLPNHHLLCI